MWPNHHAEVSTEREHGSGTLGRCVTNPNPLHRAAVQSCAAAALALGAGLQQGSQALLPHQPKGTKSNGVILSSLPMAALKGQCLLRVNN